MVIKKQTQLVLREAITKALGIIKDKDFVLPLQKRTFYTEFEQSLFIEGLIKENEQYSTVSRDGLFVLQLMAYSVNSFVESIKNDDSITKHYTKQSILEYTNELQRELLESIMKKLELSVLYEDQSGIRGFLIISTTQTGMTRGYSSSNYQLTKDQKTFFNQQLQKSNELKELIKKTIINRSIIIEPVIELVESIIIDKQYSFLEKQKGLVLLNQVDKKERSHRESLFYEAFFKIECLRNSPERIKAYYRVMKEYPSVTKERIKEAFRKEEEEKNESLNRALVITMLQELLTPYSDKEKTVLENNNELLNELIQDGFLNQEELSLITRELILYYKRDELSFLENDSIIKTVIVLGETIRRAQKQLLWQEYKELLKLIKVFELATMDDQTIISVRSYQGVKELQYRYCKNDYYQFLYSLIRVVTELEEEKAALSNNEEKLFYKTIPITDNSFKEFATSEYKKTVKALENNLNPFNTKQRIIRSELALFFSPAETRNYYYQLLLSLLIKASEDGGLKLASWAPLVIDSNRIEFFMKQQKNS